MNSASKTLFAMSLTAMLAAAACGPVESSDPTRDYKDLGDVVQPHEVKPRTQEYIGSEIYQINVRNGESLNFIEGQQKSYIIDARVTIKNKAVLFNLIGRNLPKGASLQRNEKAGASSWVLTWTPAKGLIPANMSTHELQTEFEIVPLPGTDAEAMNILQKLTRKQTLSVGVRRNEQQPVIVKVSNFKEEVTEGEEFPFSIEVNDPSAYAGNPPRLVKVDYQAGNTELFEADGAAMVSMKKPAAEQTKAGTWVFPMTFDTKRMPIPAHRDAKGNIDESSPSVTVRFTYTVNGANRLGSPEKTFKVKINRSNKGEAPEVRFGSLKSAATFNAGLDNSLSFTIFTSNPKGKVEFDVEAMNAALSSWPGRPTVACDSANSSLIRNCEMNWKVPCDDASLKSEYSLAVEAKNTIYGKSESAKQTKTIRIVKKAEVCPTKKVETVTNNAVKEPVKNAVVTKEPVKTETAKTQNTNNAKNAKAQNKTANGGAQ